MKKKAFTLTELLVVVVIIGVLSAVVLPKFSKILQTRKTTEAENVMAAVRNEQEARCMIGRNYVGQDEISKLASLPKATSKNYTYSLDKQGITATAKDGEYELKIPSYTDGRICCSGAGCDKLNKDYPQCGSFTPDEATCEAPEPRPQTCEHPTNPDAAEDCERSGGTWNAQDCTCACPEGTHDDGSATCVSEKPQCDLNDASIKQKKALCDDPDYYYYEGTWNMDTCSCDCPPGKAWQEGEGCVPTCDIKDSKIADKKELCEDPSYSGTGAKGSWNMSKCGCDCDAGSTWQDGQGCVPTCEKTNENLGNAQTCEQPQDPAAVAGTWAWEGANACKCVCPQGSTLDKYGECISACAKTDENLWKAQDCELGSQDRHVIAVDPGGEYYNIGLGTWNWATCKCDCPDDPESYLPGVTWEYVLYNDQCYLHCTSNHSGRQSIEECVYGSAADREKGIAVPGYWNQWSCQCQCATRYGAKERKSNGEVTSCYRENCESNPGYTKAECERTGTAPTGKPIYVKGKWDAENCRCNCPKGDVKFYYGSCIKTKGNGYVDDDSYYGDGWRDNDGPDDYPDREEWPDQDPDDPELDDDYMGSGVYNGTDDSTDPSFFGLGMGYDEETGWFGIDVVVHRGDDDGGDYLGDDGWGYYDD